MLAGLFVGDPWLATLAVVACITATTTAYSAKLDKAFVDEGLCSYNAVLFGCGISVFLGFDQWTWQPAVVTFTGSIFVPFVSMAVARLSEVPAWTWGFNFCVLAVLLHVQPFAGPAPEPPPDEPLTLSDLEWTDWVKAVPIGISQVYVVNDWIAGVLIALGLAAHSRLLCAASVLGSTVG